MICPKTYSQFRPLKKKKKARSIYCIQYRSQKLQNQLCSIKFCVSFLILPGEFKCCQLKTLILSRLSQHFQAKNKNCKLSNFNRKKQHYNWDCLLHYGWPALTLFIWPAMIQTYPSQKLVSQKSERVKNSISHRGKLILFSNHITEGHSSNCQDLSCNRGRPKETTT